MFIPKSIFIPRLVLSTVLVCLPLIGVQAHAGRAQSTEVPTLQLNQPQTGSLKGGESNFYKLHADAGMLVRVQVTQQGVDLAVQSFDPQKTRLARYDDSFGRVGPQLLEFLADKSADYSIEVLARPNEVGGKYEVSFVEARPATNQDRIRIAANTHVTAGNSYRSRISPSAVRDAIVEYGKALSLYDQIKYRPGRAMVLYYIARMYETQSDYRRALENYSAALSLWRALSDRRAASFAISNIGTMHLYLSNLELAYASFVEAGAIHRELGNKEGEALAYQEIGNVYRQQGDMAKALTLFNQALPIYRELGAKLRMVYVFSNIGVAYEGLGDLQQAAAYQNQALAIARAINLKHGISLAHMNLGDVYAQRGETRQALSFYQQALPTCLEIGDDNCAGRSYRRLAGIYESLGEAQTALDYYAKGATIYRQKERPVELARMLNSAGTLYSSLGDKTRAFDLHSEALVVSRKAQSRQDEAASLSNLADLHQDRGETQKAREYYQQALTISREIKNRQSEATNLNRLGLLAPTGVNQEAIKYFEEALAINNELGAKPNGAVTLNNLGVAYEREGNSKLALDYFSRALKIFREIENRNGEAMMLFRTASVQKKLGQLDEARRNVRSALEIIETIRGKIANTDLRSSYLSTVQDYYGLYIDLLMQEHRNRPTEALNLTALQVSEQARARSLLDLLQEAKADVRQDVDTKLLTREKELLELINGKVAQQQQVISDPKKAELAKSLAQEIARLSDEYESLQASIRQSNPRFAELVHARPIPLEQLQKLIDEQTVLLEYKLSSERSYLWMVSGAGLKSFDLAPRADIETLSRQFYEAITERNRSPKTETPIQRQARLKLADERVETTSRQLAGMLFGAVGDSIRDKRLVIVADGALQYVPFSGLVNAAARNGAPAANEVISLPSIGVLAQLRNSAGRQQPAKSVAVFADPVFESDDPRLPAAVRKKVTRFDGALAQSQSDFDFGLDGSGLPRLFASREEAKAILALTATGTSYGALDFEANRERAMSAELNGYRILHFAAHGLLNTARPQFSGIVLSLYDEKGQPRDGFLRLNQIYNLRLSSKLVVLSACSTALGKDVRGEGLIGLTRGFMYAGVPQVIASLWKVDDEATAELMTIFYRNLLRAEMPPAKALREAQLEMQRQPRWRSPYYWGAFVLQGDWR